MRIFTFFIFLSLSIVTLQAQEVDTLYYDQDWKPINSQKNAAFFRPPPLSVEGAPELVLLRDYYINGDLQMQAYALAQNHKALHGYGFFYEDGEVTQNTYISKEAMSSCLLTYYFEDGQKYAEYTFTNEGANGPYKIYHPTGKIVEEGTMQKGKVYNAKSDELQLVENGEEKATRLYYLDVFQIAKENILHPKYDWKKEHSIVYDKDGNILADLKTEDFEGPENYTEHIDHDELYNGTRCIFHTHLDFATHLASIEHFVEQKKEGEHIWYNKDGSIMCQGTYKNGKPQNGTIYIDNFDILRTTDYLNGQKHGREIVELRQRSEDRRDYFYITIGDGELQNGEPITGSFVLPKSKRFREFSCYTVFSLIDGKPNGVYSYYHSGEFLPLLSYTVKDGKKEGILSSIGVNDSHDYETVKMLYKDGEPYEGILRYYDIWETKYQLEYKDGKATKEINYQSSIDGESPLIGTYQNGQPYNGYFTSKKNYVTLVDYYEEGKKIFQYSSDYPPAPFINVAGHFSPAPYETDFRESLELPYKATYKDGEIYTGKKYEGEEENYLNIYDLKEGKIVGTTNWIYDGEGYKKNSVTQTDTGYEISSFDGQDYLIRIETESDKNGHVSLATERDIIMSYEYELSDLHSDFNFEDSLIQYYQTEDGVIQENKRNVYTAIDDRDYKNLPEAYRDFFENLCFVNLNQKSLLDQLADMSLLSKDCSTGLIDQLIIKDGTPQSGILMKKGKKGKLTYDTYKDGQLISKDNPMDP